MPTDRFDDHSLPTLIYYDVATLLSTDGADVMHTTLAEEYGRARVVLEGVLSGKLPVRISAADAMVGGTVRGREVAGRPDERELHIGEMTSDERGRFEHGYKKLYGDAEAYYRGRPKGPRGQTVDVDAYTGIATRHRLKKRFGHTTFEGERSAIDAAIDDYRAAGYRVTQSDADHGALTVLTSPDEQVTLTLTTTIEESKR